MFALVKIIVDVATGKFHPIFYFESPLPGPIETQTVLRYKSKAHHTAGFVERDAAVENAKNSLQKKLEEQGYVVTIELEPEQDIAWDSTKDSVPADVQLRNFPTK